jgi:hypothetical protein
VNCCGDSPPHEGLTLKFPFGTEKVTYQFWDSTAKAAFPAEYQRTETLNGLTVYVFVSEVPQTLIGPMTIPSALAGQPPGTGVEVFRWYTATTTLWIEPTTGAIVKAGQDANQWATNGGTFVTTLALTSFVQDEASVEKTAKRVRDQIFQLKIVTTWGWIIGLAVGLPLIVLGFVLVFGSRRREQEEAAAPRSIETLPAS